MPANMDWNTMGCVDVGAYADGDSAAGCRQMLGNVWEWIDGVYVETTGALKPGKAYWIYAETEAKVTFE